MCCRKDNHPDREQCVSILSFARRACSHHSHVHVRGQVAVEEPGAGVAGDESDIRPAIGDETDRGAIHGVYEV
jgi:hypothetical protein